MPSRAATPEDAASAASVIRQAFADDPIWGPALRRSDSTPLDLDAYWRLFVDGAIRFGSAMVATDGAAFAIWLPPPAEPELSQEQAAALDALIAHDLDPGAADDLHALFERFEASRAGRPAHAYLSLLATHPDHRGQGRGQILLAECLELWDATGVPCYLESTNAANDHRYERLGFRRDGGFSAVRDDAWISAMWRPVGGD